MKKTVSILLLLVMLFALVGCSGGNSEGKSGESEGDLPADLQAIVDRGVLRVGVKTDVPGFGYQNPDTNEVEGMEIDIAKALAKKLLGDENKIETTGVTAQTR
ncbi:MAG: transporter substrate-binding domain-containing protein, partial [Firmicutes bacterium]|nr:transporter substrate-binding domain-containing protein [Bacillota bacterium]